MIIDFHSHAFPDAVAGRAIDALKKGIKSVSGTDIEPVTDGTLAGLADISVGAGVTKSVVLPIATKPSQTESINSFAVRIPELSGGRLMSFGSVHPADPGAPDAVAAIAEAGLPGIKLHPEFQQSYIDSPESMAVLRAARDHGLCVTVHAGRDIGLPPPVHCTPDMMLRVLDVLPGLKLIAAHLGGWMMWDEVAARLSGAPLYFDTAFISDYAEPAAVRDIINAHGADRVLLGSDCPWEDPAKSIAFVRSLGLENKDEELILGGNAKKLLNLQ